MPSEQSKEILHGRVRDELEMVYKSRLQKSHNQCDALRQEMSQMTYQLTFLQSEYDHSQKIHNQRLHEVEVKYQTQVSNVLSEYCGISNI